MTDTNPELTTEIPSGNSKERKRANLWAATMTGATNGKFTWAHGPITYVPFEGPQVLPQDLISGILGLEARLEVERLLFSPSATFSTPIESRKRNNLPGFSNSEKLPLKDLELRTRFEHDRDRIKHFEAFR